MTCSMSDAMKPILFSFRGLFLAHILAGAPQVLAHTTIEYIAHACFVIESPSGTRVVIDPYNSSRWLGYSFPEEVRADAVLVTHPHYDHDASYYWSRDVPVFRAPGRYTVGDVSVRGLRGHHADPYGKEFGQRNTVWLIEAGGLRILHLGDNGPPSRELLAEFGRVDVLMPPVDDLDHILKADELAALRTELRPKIVLPMHYRLTAVSELPKSVGLIDEWLSTQPGVRRIEKDTARLSPFALPKDPEVWVLDPSAHVKPWDERLHQAWALRDDARNELKRGAADRALKLLQQANTTVPEAAVFAVELAELLAKAAHHQEAIGILERTLASGPHDWEYLNRGRILLAQLYASSGNRSGAAEQYRLVLRDSDRSEWLLEAERFLGDSAGASTR